MDDLIEHIKYIILKTKERRQLGYDDPIRKASSHGYIEALEEILEFIEDNQ
jgi:hypothetical protein